MARWRLAMVILAAGCASPAPSVDHRTDSTAIQALNARWFAAENAKNVDSVMQFLAPEFVLHLACLPPVSGDSALRALFAGFLQSLDHIEGESTRLVIAANGDLAYDLGNNRMTLRVASDKTQNDSGKYLIVWRKLGGTWKAVAASSISSVRIQCP